MQQEVTWDINAPDLPVDGLVPTGTRGDRAVVVHGVCGHFRYHTLEHNLAVHSGGVMAMPAHGG